MPLVLAHKRSIPAGTPRNSKPCANQPQRDCAARDEIIGLLDLPSLQDVVQGRILRLAVHDIAVGGHPTFSRFQHESQDRTSTPHPVSSPRQHPRRQLRHTPQLLRWAWPIPGAARRHISGQRRCRHTGNHVPVGSVEHCRTDDEGGYGHACCGDLRVENMIRPQAF